MIAAAVGLAWGLAAGLGADLASGLEATALAQFLKGSRWVYPLVNAGHLLGVALLVGAVAPMDLRLLGLVGGPPAGAAVALLRPFAAAGLALAVVCGALLFVTQAGDYAASAWFRTKMAVLVLAALNAAVHPRIERLAPWRRRAAAAASLALWPTVLILGRMVGYA